MLAAVRRGLVRQFVPRHPYRMLIKRVSTVSKYLTAAAARRSDCGPIGAERVRYSFRGAVEPNVCQWASTVVPRYRVGGPRPPAKALPYATGTAMCTIYSFSFSLLPSLLLSHSLLTHPFPFPSVSRCIFPSHSLLSSRSPSFPPSWKVIRTRETLSPSLFLFLPSGLFVSLLAPCVSFLVRFSSRKFAHLVTRSNTVGCVVAAARSV